MKNVGAVILAGGKSRRMGTNKANLPLAGETFLSRIHKQLSGFDEILLSVDQHSDLCASGLADSGLTLVEDLYQDHGPIGGIYSALSCCQAPHLLVVSCDTPLFSRGLAEFLLSYITEGYDAFAAVTRDGRIHPSCCVYAKSALPMLGEMVQNNDLQLLEALNRLKVKKVMLAHSAYADETLYNVNSHAQYIELCRRVQGPPIIAVSGVKNSGKTTLLANLLPLLRRAGLKVALLKHDGHDYEPDVPGTDSYILRQAGAEVVAVYSDQRYLVTAVQSKVRPDSLLEYCRDFDLLILEGGKYSPYPKIEVVRAAVSTSSVCDPHSLLGIATDTGLQVDNVPRIRLDDYEAMADLVLQYIYGEYYPDTSAWEANPAAYGFPTPAELNKKGGK